MKIKKLEELRNLQKGALVEEMLKGTIKGGSSCANIGPGPRPPFGPTIGAGGQLDLQP